MVMLTQNDLNNLHGLSTLNSRLSKKAAPAPVQVSPGVWKDSKGNITATGGYMKPTYTPNPYTAAQLSSMNYGGASVPQWMSDAYARKINSMGGGVSFPNAYAAPSAAPQAQPQTQQGAATGGLPAPVSGALLSTLDRLRNIRAPLGGKSAPAATQGTSPASTTMINGRNVSGFR